MTKVIIFVAI